MPAVIMPKMGDAMEEGTLLKGLKNEGESVALGEPIAEIETDKVTLELEAENAGTLARRMAQEGESVPVGKPIAMILDEGESPDGGEAQAAAPAQQAQQQALAVPAAPPTAESGETTHGAAVLGQEQRAAAAPATAGGRGDQPTPVTSGSTGAAAPATAGGQGDGRAAEAEGRVKASPLARRMAQEREIDLAQVKGSGPGGRIVREDVGAPLRQPQGGAAPAAPAAAQAPPTQRPAAAPAGAESVPLTR